MQDIGIGAARVIAVSRSEKSPIIFLEFRGVRDAPHTVDKDTRIRIALSVDRAGDLRRRLWELLPSQIEWQSQFLHILAAHQAKAKTQ
jgi:hypothetical protein